MKQIYIISSYANDIIKYNNTISKWWPAFFIKNNLENLWAHFILISWNKPWEVIIDKSEDWEDIWKITKINDIEMENWINDSLVLISTLEQEFDLKNLEKIKNSIVILDIQWFIRKIWSIKKTVFKNDFFNNINYIKSTKEELKYIDIEIINHFKNIKNWWLIITKWWDWISFYSSWKKVEFSVERWNFKDTIWAWDTFISSFVYFKSIWKKDEDSIMFSIKNTYNFLKNKNINY
jgi:hypothetical protein